MKKIILLLLFFSTFSFAQVGIGTTNPTAKLEIDASADAIPALEIVPRTTAPTGTANGQISVIDGSLYIYDLTRAKWLSSETITYTFGLNGANNGQYLQFARVADGLSGAKVLRNATIVGVTAVASGGAATKLLEIDGSSLGYAFTSFNLTARQYLSTLTDLNIPSGEILNIWIPTGTDTNNITVTLHVKWRK